MVNYDLLLYGYHILLYNKLKGVKFMGLCKYCGKECGFFQSKHKECEKHYIKNKNAIINIIKTLDIRK